MRCERIVNDHSPHYPAFRAANDASFPDNEKRDDALQAAALANPRYHLDAWLDGDAFVGFMGWWDFDDYRYIEHIAVAPGARSGGYGRAIVQRWLSQSATPVYLEIEKVVDALTTRRLNFYLRLGFVTTPMQHEQPAYRGGAPVPLQVLSWPEELTREQYDRFFAALHNEVWTGLG